VDSIYEFLRTGAVHQVRRGSTVDDVTAVLGPPDAVARAGRRARGRILRYGVLQVFVGDDDRVWMLGVSVDDAPAPATAAVLDVGGFTRTRTSSAVAADLSAHGIAHRVLDPEHIVLDDADIAIFLASGGSVKILAGGGSVESAEWLSAHPAP
jgi:hypothetical protein